MRAVSNAEPSSGSTPPSRHHGGESTTLRIEAPPPSTLPGGTSSDSRRKHLERELDRVQNALAVEQSNFGRQLTWQMLSQGVLVNAYMLVLVVGWSTPLPAKRWLLAALAIFATVVAVLIFFAQRGSSEAVQALRATRRELEAILKRDFHRAPLFAPPSVVTRNLGTMATALLPVSFIVGWTLLTVYTLAAPIGSQDAAVAQAAKPAQVVRSAAPRAPAGGAPAAAVTQPAEEVPVEPAPPRRTGFKW